MDVQEGSLIGGQLIGRSIARVLTEAWSFMDVQEALIGEQMMVRSIARASTEAWSFMDMQEAP